MSRVYKIIGLLMVLFLSVGAMASEKVETRCGWFENPTPANTWIRDKDGEWIIGSQGGHQADGDWPEFKESQWVITNAGGHGYGCACITGVFNGSDKEIVRIVSAKAKSLAVCQNDKSLPSPECKKVAHIRKKLVCADYGNDLKALYEQDE